MTAPVTSPTIDQIYKHGSVRSYRDTPVPAETVEAIVAAAQRSATSSNLQVYSVVAVTDAETKQQISEVAGNQKQIVQAPVVLIWKTCPVPPDSPAWAAWATRPVVTSPMPMLASA